MFMFVAIVTTLMLLSKPIQSTPPKNSTAFSQEFAHVFDKMIEEGLQQSKDFKSSSVYYAYEDIRDNGINEIGKRNKVTAKAREYQEKILNDTEVTTNKTNALHPTASPTEWTLFLINSCLFFEKILQNDIPNIILPTTGKPRTIIEKNNGLKLSRDQKAAFLAIHLVIASNIYALYSCNRMTFNKLHAAWCENAFEDKAGECTIS